MLESINPATGERIRSYEETTPQQVASIVAAADRAQRSWRSTPIAERARLLTRVAERLRAGKERYAALMAAEVGKPLAQGRAEAEKCAWVCNYFAEGAAAFLAPEEVESDASRSYVAFPPLGTVLAVMPWNFPFWQVFRFAAPALMAGNAGLLKHASNVCGCALAIGEAFREAGAPEGLFGVLLIRGARVADVIAAPEIRAVTLTGSTPAGRAVAASAGTALKKTVLELGGSDPYVILEDADLDAAAETCAAARLINSGQSCIAAKRFILPRSVQAAFVERFVAAMRARRMGDPTDESVDLGPQARRDLRDQLHAQVRESAKRGARVILGGDPPPGPGAFYPPTVLLDVRPGMPAYEEELFGPVAAVIAAEDEEDAIRIANDSAFGLGAAIFSRDAARAERIAADRLEAGSCFVNAFVKSDPRLPFGGIKASGYGRELSHFGIREFVNVKTVYVK
jgi:succinate-semialdehyde dehydrogenase / glutarate-semialdehyde dehydrogenase